MNRNELATGFAPEFMNVAPAQEEILRDCQEISCPPVDANQTQPRLALGLTKPMVILPADGKDSITECAQALWSAIGQQEDTMYWRGNSGQGQTPIVAKLVRDCGNNAVLGIVDIDTFRADLPNLVTVFGWRKDRTGTDVLKPNVLCSADVAGVLLKSNSIRECLPPITAVHKNPIIVECGEDPSETEVLSNGYHSQGGGRLITGNVVPEEMSLCAARQALQEILQDFIFASEGDRARAFAALIMPALKFGGLLLSHTPMFVIEAEKSQTGKGYLAEVIQAVYGESAKLIAQNARGGVGSLDEKISQALIDGNPFIQFDNVRGKVNSQLFEMILTCSPNGSVGARVPHRGEIRVNPGPFIFHLTGNGYETTEDLANRSCIIRLRKREGQVFYEWPEGDLIREIQRHQERYLGAVFAIVREWVARGKQRSRDITWGGRFREWWQTADWIVRELLDMRPILEGHHQARERATNPMLAWLREVAIALETDNRLGGDGMRTSALCDYSQEREIEIPGIPGNLSDDRIYRSVGGKLGKVFREASTREIDSFTVSRLETTEYDRLRQEHYPCIKYVFRRTETENDLTPDAPATPATV